MTGDERGGSTAGLCADRRARVPFALVAVVLLVSAVALVGFLETRGSAETDTDAALAMDRTEAAVQTAVRDATATAAIRAAERPVTSPANTSYGDALDGARTFESYLEALVYLDAAERLAATGQRVGAVETSVSLPAVTDASAFADAVERVSVTEGDEPGLLDVTVSGIETTATRDGEVVATRTETVSVSVPTPVLQQHERTETFQERLDAGITSTKPGFSHRFNARIYALGWLRGYAQYGGAPVTEVIANRHVEPSANSALYRTQQDVFGTADPNLGDAVRRGWFCMAAQDAQGLYNGYSTGETNVADDACRASEWVLGEKHTGELPDTPETLDLLSGAPGMDEEETLGVNETAYLPLGRLVAGSGEHSIEAAIDRVFTIETDIEAAIDAETASFSHDRPHPDAVPTATGRTHESLTVTGGSAHVNTTAGEHYYTFEAFDVAVELTETREWRWVADGEKHHETTEDTATLDADVTVHLREGTTAPEARVDAVSARNVSHEYEYGPAPPVEERTVPAPAPAGFQNYADSEADIAMGVVGGANATAFETWLADHWSGATAVANLTLPDSRRVTLDPDQRAALVATIVDDITAIQRAVTDINHTFERADLVHDGSETGPVGELVAKVEAERDAYLEREDAYENVGQKAVYEARHAYFEVLVDALSSLEGAHSAVMDNLDSHLDEIDSSLDTVLSFLQQGVEGTGLADSPDAEPLESPDLTPDITYEVSGSPTYLAGEPVTTDTVPAVDSGGEFSPFAAKNANYLKLPYETVVSGIISTVREHIPGMSGSDVELTLRTAGEALRAGELAADAAAADDGYADGGELDSLNADLRDSLADGLDEFADEMGVEVVTELYPVEHDAFALGGLGVPEHVDEARVATTEATASALEGYGSTAEAAIAVGAGNATDSLVTAVAQALDSDSVQRPGYAGTLGGDEWRAVVASAVRRALDRAAANATATLGDTDTVEALDTATRQALENVSADIVAERLGAALGNGSFELSAYDDWVDGVDTPVRVPAGLPVLPVPTHWVATMNLWNIDADGQYARFEVRANMSAPGRATSTTYVRENATVEREIAGARRTLGSVEPVGFDGRSLLVVVVPPGGIGVGDRDDENPECTETYPVVGPFEADATTCDALGAG